MPGGIWSGINGGTSTPPNMTITTTGTGAGNLPVNNSGYWTQPLYGHSGSHFNIPSYLNIKQHEQYINDKIKELEKFKDEQEVLNNLHPETKNLIDLVYKLTQNNKVEDLKALDKYIKTVMYGNKINNYLEEK